MAPDEGARSGGPMERLKSEARDLIGAFGDRALSSVQEKVEGMTDRLADYAEGGGGPGFVGAVTGAKDLAEGKSPVRSVLGGGMTAAKEKIASAFGKGGKGGDQGKKLKVTNIVESIDVGVPIKVAYNQWTQFTDFPKFMKKVENVDQQEAQKLTWKAQVFWSHRTWEATVVEQTPDDKIIWRSKGEKGHVDGAVTFHELAPNLTRILVVLEYHPQGLFERTGNLWRAQGRRVRLELKHFRRHVMTEAIRHADEIEGWRGVIEDGEVVQDHDEAVEAEGQDEGREAAGDRDGEDRDGEGRDSEDRDREDRESEGRDREAEGRADEDQPDEDEEERGSGAGRRASGERQRRGADKSGSRDRRSTGRPRQSGRSGRSDDSRPRARASARRGDDQ